MVLTIVKKGLMMIGIVALCSHCIFEEKEEFFCDKNSLVTINSDDKQCASGRVDRYSINETEPSEMMEIDISWSVASLTLYLQTQGRLLEEGETYTNGNGANYWFPEINQSFATSITITTLDRENKTICGEFTYSGEGAYNYQAYKYESKGAFEEVVYEY